MILEKVIGMLALKSGMVRLYLGAVLAALLICLGMLGAVALLNVHLNPAIPSVVGVAGAAVYIAKHRKG